MPTKVVLSENGFKVPGKLQVDFSPFERVRVLIWCYRDSEPVSVRLVHTNELYNEARADLDAFEVTTNSIVTRIYEIPGTQTYIDVSSSQPSAIGVCIYGFAPH
jgi:hypothetical protein